MKKVKTHNKKIRQKIRRTVDALTQITDADPISFLTSVMHGKPFSAAHPENPTKSTLQYPTREQRVLVAMYLASRIAPPAKTNTPAAGSVNVVIRSNHSNEPTPRNMIAAFQQTPGVIIDATPTQGSPPAPVRRDRASADPDT